MLKLTKGVGRRVMLLNEETRRPVVLLMWWVPLGEWHLEEERIIVRGFGDRRIQLRTEAERGRRGGGEDAVSICELFCL